MKDIPRKCLGSGLLSVAATTCSVTLASVLIDLGADLDYRISKHQAKPLQRAAQQDTDEAAKFLRFLLYRGANPEIEYDKQRALERGHPNGRKYVSTPVKISEEVGAIGVSKWLERSWEDLVAEARVARMNNDKPPIPED
jgi:ankyrin repeat protein